MESYILSLTTAEAMATGRASASKMPSNSLFSIFPQRLFLFNKTQNLKFLLIFTRQSKPLASITRTQSPFKGIWGLPKEPLTGSFLLFPLDPPQKKKNTSCKKLLGSPRKSHKEGQEDQGEAKELGGSSPSCFKDPWSSWLSLWLFPGLQGLLSNKRKALPQGRLGAGTPRHFEGL